MSEWLYKLPLILEPQPEGGYTITSPLIPELVTEADTLEQVVPHVADALAALLELYEELGKPVPPVLRPLLAEPEQLLWTETLIPATRVSSQ